MADGFAFAALQRFQIVGFLNQHDFAVAFLNVDDIFAKQFQQIRNERHLVECALNQITQHRRGAAHAGFEFGPPGADIFPGNDVGNQNCGQPGQRKKNVAVIGNKP